MTMGVRVYYSEISGSKEVKKRQQRVMMILESKSIPYEAVDITEPGKEKDKDFMLQNAKPRGDTKIILSPQIFKDDLYCGDYDAFDLANENDTLEEFLGSPKIENNVRGPSVEKTVVNGKAGSREPSAEVEAKAPVESSNGNATEEIVNTPSDPQSTEEESRDVTDAVPSEEPPEEEKKSKPAAEDEETSAQETTKTEEEAGADE